MTATAVPIPAATGGSAAAVPGLFAPPAHLAVDEAAVSPDVFCGIALRQARRRADRVNLQVKVDGRWLPVTWAEQHGSSVAVAAALVHAGIAAGERLAILGENRLEWLAADLGAQFAAAVVVPIYASSSSDTVEAILRDCAAAAVVCSTPEQAAKVVAVADRLPALRLRALMDGSGKGFESLSGLVAAATAADVATVGERMAAVAPDDPMTIIYTSGTTGAPKGVVLTQRNVVDSTRALLQTVPLYDTDRGISFLPWAHVYERVQGIVAGTLAGVEAAVAPDLNSIGDDLRAVRPTLMNGVPRLYEKMQEAILARMRSGGGARARLGLRALDDATAAARLRRRGRRVPVLLALRVRVWDRLVLSPIRLALGGRARMFSSGGGPINIATLEFFDALGIAITEGYGLTETTGGVAANDPRHPRFGTVGRPTPGHEVRIAEDGEILVRGPGVMREYFNNPEATAKVIREGWFSTGDIGEIDPDGYLRITDRKKDLIVTAGGKNIAPAPIEAALMRDPLVERAVVIGDRRKFLVALVVPDFGGLEVWARARNIATAEPAELVRDPRVVGHYASLAERVSSDRARYETIKKIAVLDRDLSEERGELTPTLKAKRRVVTENFADVIEELYAG